MKTCIEVALIEAHPHQTFKATRSLRVNCTHVDGNIWIFEGDIETLKKDGIVFREIERGAVEPIEDKSPRELRNMCFGCFHIKKSIFKKDYHEPRE